MLFHPQTCQQVPASICTGRSLSLSNQSDESFSAVFKVATKEEVIKKGFFFYAEEFAEASLLASRIANLALSL